MVCGGILDPWLLPLDSDMALPDETGPIEAHELAQRRRELAQGLRALAVGRDPLGRRREEARDPPQAIREHIAGNSRSDAGFLCLCANLGAAVLASQLICTQAKLTPQRARLYVLSTPPRPPGRRCFAFQLICKQLSQDIVMAI